MIFSLIFTLTNDTCERLAGIAQSIASAVATTIGIFRFRYILSRKGWTPFISITRLGSAFFMPLSQGLKYSTAYCLTLNIFHK